ncbi:proliferating cell nuclear antigen (pcna) [archaeon]|jgi:proliferating cell nuclear antigen|nr:proliferating cell nuclear antigen (pcna) [archaeon]MBT4023003.1 proliferating cell nuclear antigen (pcna) [archaeon]MBT4271994.1 proliferating cell nuclear antigen (pcna) [archaeon]MBT4461832.1 proliferating cell nuclear antigen (pcna) [archaeon]MBT4858153.1 proliferating cell nuclear antigen (pcna) [archaeon]
MKLTLADSKLLKDSVSIISDLVTEARFTISKDSIDLIAMDPANVAMVIFKLLSSSFTEYKIDKEVKVALNLNNLKQVLKRSGPNDVLTLELEENKFKVTIRANTTRTFYLPIIELEEREQKIPSLSFPISIKADTVTLNEAIEDVSIVAESVRFSADAKKFTISAEGDLSKAKIEIPSDDNTIITKEGEETLNAKYSIEYLKKMIQGSKLSPSVYVRFNSDYPLKLEYKVTDQLMLAFILAPRVDND